MLNGLDLFSGIGGISLALSPWTRTIAYCENERYAQAVLLSRMSRGELEVAPIWDDVRTITGEMLPPIDIIYAGFPCQDISVAGNGNGLAGPRSGLFSEVGRLVREIKPSFLFLENVPGIRTRGAERVVKELASAGYDSRWTVISAAEVGAPHIRKRWFLLAANTEREQLRFESWWGSRKSGQNKTKSSIDCETPKGGWGRAKPKFCRMDDGLFPKVDRFRALGNAVVPLQAREAFKRLMGITRVWK